MPEIKGFFKQPRLFLGVVLLSLLAIVVLGMIVYLQPIPPSLTTAATSPVLYSKNGELLGARVASDGQWRLHYDDPLPANYVTALLTFEDKRFYRHPGIDPLAVGRAFISNWQQERVVSGASTLTMQLARLIQPARSRNLSAKMNEALLALKLEATYGKDEILQLYANHAPFGGNTVGIQSAAWRYFHLPVSELSWAQVSLLAVLPKNPSDFRLSKNRHRLKERRDRLLTRLYKNGAIDKTELKLALLEPLPEAPRQMPDLAPHWFAHLQTDQVDNNVFHTTLDKHLQQQALRIADSHLGRIESHRSRNIAIVVVDNRTQALLAYIGNHAERSEVNANHVDIALSPRSSGSLFKPFLFAWMIQRGDILPQSLVLDIPTYYRGYQPQNYDRHYRGAVPASEAIRQSLNVPSVRMLKAYGVEAFKDDLESIGLTTLFRPADEYGLSLILGGAETNLFEMTQSYSLLMQSAMELPPRAIRSIQSGPPVNVPFSIKQGAAWLTIKTLAELNRPAIQAYWREFASSPEIAWKTGTSFGFRDAWAIGSNKAFTVGVWTGNANSEEGINLSGTKTAAPIMFDMFRALPASNLPLQPTHALKSYRVCKSDGYLSKNGCATEEALAPKEALFTRQSKYHIQLHTDKNGLRVHGNCEDPFNMQSRGFFQLPAIAHFYYQQNNPDLPLMPALRSDCQNNLPGALADSVPIDIEYPDEGAKIKLPVKLDGVKSALVLKAHHRSPNAVLFWHLDKHYLGKTDNQHELSVKVSKGWHQLTLVDNEGFEKIRWFKVL